MVATKERVDLMARPRRGQAGRHTAQRFFNELRRIGFLPRVHFAERYVERVLRRGLQPSARAFRRAFGAARHYRQSGAGRNTRVAIMRDRSGDTAVVYRMGGWRGRHPVLVTIYPPGQLPRGLIPVATPPLREADTERGMRHCPADSKLPSWAAMGARDGGCYYRIRRGDNLFRIARRALERAIDPAYVTQAMVTDYARGINSSPYNSHLRERSKPTAKFPRSIFGERNIGPAFYGIWDKERRVRVGWRGGNYAVIHLPPVERYIPNPVPDLRERTASETAPLYEVDRRSRDYVRWVQSSLNRLTGAGLAVDGISGARTRAAVRSFQRRAGLTADGIVGSLTEGALVRAGASRPPTTTSPAGGGAVNTPLPAAGRGYYKYQTSGDLARGTDHGFGTAQTIRAIQEIGRRWHARHPGGPRLGVGHISLRGGGKTPAHSSHRSGLDVDFRPVRGDGREGAANIRDAAYSRALTQELVDIIRSNAVLTVRTILFNDTRVRGVTKWEGHDDHLHVSFQPASRESGAAFERDAMFSGLDPAAIPPDVKQQIGTMARLYFAVYGPRLRELVNRTLAQLRVQGPYLTPKATLFRTAHAMNIPRRHRPGHPGKLTAVQVRQARRRRLQRLPRRRKRYSGLRRY